LLFQKKRSVNSILYYFARIWKILPNFWNHKILKKKKKKKTLPVFPVFLLDLLISWICNRWTEFSREFYKKALKNLKHWVMLWKAPPLWSEDVWFWLQEKIQTWLLFFLCKLYTKWKWLSYRDVKTQSQKSKLPPHLVQLMWNPRKIHYGPLSVKAFCSQWVVFHKVLFWTALWGIVIGPSLQSPSTPLVPIYTCFQILSRKVWIERLTARFLSLHIRGASNWSFLCFWKEV
jgi:hypothetical protein